MNKRDLVLGVTLGFVTGYILRHQLEEKSKLSPERALQIAKEKFEQTAPIVGSWIYVNKERVEINGLPYDTYRGGISRQIDNQTKQIEFHIDTETGAIVQADTLDL